MFHSPSKLNNFLACPHLSKLEAAATLDLLPRPYTEDPLLELIRNQGDRHEKTYLSKLEDQFQDTAIIDSEKFEEKYEQTIHLIKDGRSVIFQAALKFEDWIGYADFLVKSKKPSNLGSYSYSIHDTKLSSEVKGSAIVQLCIYSEMLEKIQGCLPEKIVVVGGKNHINEFNPADFIDYLQYAKNKYLNSLSADLKNIKHLAAEPVEKCHSCDWRGHCEDVWKTQDHLKLIAGSSRRIRKDLRSIGLSTLAQVGQLDRAPELPKTSKESCEKIFRQARIQLKARNSGKHEHEFILPIVENQGLSGLPMTNEGDIFFDIEGDGHIGELGVEYLFGWVTIDNDEQLYHHEWAMNNLQEKAAFEKFISFIMDRKKMFPGLHVYHFGHYEATVVRRLSTRYNVFVDEVDDMLRQELFVNLHRVVKNGIRLSVTGYGLKEIEGHYDFQRDWEDLRKASMARKRIALLLDSQLDIGDEHKRLVHDYNKEDCISTLKLHEWLESRREELEKTGVEIPRFNASHDDKDSSPPNDKIVKLSEISDQLYHSLMNDEGMIPEDLSPEDHAKKAIADILLWYRREDKSYWWEYFHKMEMTREEMIDERKTLAGPFHFVGITGEKNYSKVYRWSYRKQTFDGFKDALKICPDGKGLPIHDFDTKSGWFEITRKEENLKEIAQLIQGSIGLVASTYFSCKNQLDRFIDLGTDLLKEKWIYPCIENLLLRRQVLKDVRTLEEETSVLESAKRLAHHLKNGAVLPIQGPPGTGKTFTAAHMICELVLSGKKVGITAQSHSVIRNLLQKLHEVRSECYPDFDCKIVKQRKTGSTEEDNDWMSHMRTGDIKKNNEDIHVTAGTHWLWSSPEMQKSIDVLFIDEAGQFALADAIACAHATDSMVLLGDPQQLENVSTGVHPPEIQVSVLGYWLNEEKVINTGEGLFLDRTFRMSPKIQEFVSDTFYNSKLKSSPGLENQRIDHDGPLKGAGLFYLPSEHEGNQSSSVEEVDIIIDLVDELLKTGYWYNKEDQKEQLSEEHIMIVAPYNAQVDLLKEALPGIPIGTVDKFQGKEAPVVIYSMTTSSQEEAPRGMEFLYSLNRLNVAISRAKCLALLVASPSLFEINCKTPHQMLLANGFIRYVNASACLDVVAKKIVDPT
ncbi:MAG: TM0106 family RecB-like putative nuclease [Chitinophagales bacterium]|nr:TM0106 family RecB-like putative nuclease [Chitinophagales bacterium]